MDFLREYFDFHKLFMDVRRNTLSFNQTPDKFIFDYCSDNKEEINTLYKFIKDDVSVEELLSKFEISEENNFNLNDDVITISFFEDTSTHNEGGSHFGGYEYLFKIDTDLKIFIGLEIINNN